MKNNEIKEKHNFVKNELTALCKAVNKHVVELNYLIATPSNEEYVEVLYSNTYRKRICVSCDSLKAIVLDVMKYIG